MTTWTQLLERDRAAKLFSLKGKYIKSWRTPFGKGYFQDQRPDLMSGCRHVGLALMGTPGVKQNWIPAFTVFCLFPKPQEGSIYFQINHKLCLRRAAAEKLSSFPTASGMRAMSPWEDMFPSFIVVKIKACLAQCTKGPIDIREHTDRSQLCCTYPLKKKSCCFCM